MLYQLSYARTGRPLRFTKDRKDSAQLYRRRVIEHLHDLVCIIIRDGSWFNGSMERWKTECTASLVPIGHWKFRVLAW
ncbi:MAG: hypothetical protein IIC01_04080 [Planctomycetes bacterium]|nr:hypothetical protein [Planctomycetota bacterium]